MTVPALLISGHINSHQAVATSLAIVLFISTVSAVREWRAGRIALRAVIPFATAGFAGTFTAAHLAPRYIPSGWQVGIFVLIAGVSALLMLRSALFGKKVTSGTSHASPLILAGTGLMVGLLSGTIGIGGGFLIVPALVLFAGISMQQAASTSLALIAVNSLGGVVGYVQTDLIQWGLCALFSIVGIVGSFVGLSIRHHIPERALRIGFALLLLVVAYHTWARSA